MDGEKSHGEVVLQKDGQEDRELSAFSGIDWHYMMQNFAGALVAHSDARGTIQRTDRPGLALYHLSDLDLARFRSDPEGAIKAMTFRVDESLKPRPQTVNVMQALPAAVQVITEAFGEMVYMRAMFSEKGITIISPFTGVLTAAADGHLMCPDNTPLICDTSYVEQGWVGVPVLELLLKKMEKYYLPRKWNEGTWITWADLKKRYDDFEAEREKAK